MRGSLFAEKGSFYWRVRVTDSSGERKTRKIPLKLRSESQALTLAESRIVELDAQIQQEGVLPDLLPWDAPKVEPVHKQEALNVDQCVEALEVDFWQGKIRTTAAERTWARIKAETDRLPQQATLTMDLVVGIDGTDRIDALRTPYEPEARDVPSEAEVASLLEKVIEDPTWGWCCWALDTYGCRPAEVFFLRPAEDGTARSGWLTNQAISAMGCDCAR